MFTASLMNLSKKLVRRAADSPVFPVRFAGRTVLSLIRLKRMLIPPFTDPDKKMTLAMVRAVRKESDMLLTDCEAYQIVAVVRNMHKIKGAIAEVGTYKGGCAKLICEHKGSKELHLFDTFEGIPAVGEADAEHFYAGQWAAPYERVKQYLAYYPGVYIYKGVFPQTAQGLVDQRFCFTHLDVDTYQGTRDCLSFFYPRMMPGGVFIVHDYVSNIRGVKAAVDEFFNDKPEPVIALWGSQCLVVKR